MWLDPSVYRVRSAPVILPQNANWLEATAEDVKAFSGRPVALMEAQVAFGMVAPPDQATARLAY